MALGCFSVIAWRVLCVLAKWKRLGSDEPKWITIGLWRSLPMVWHRLFYPLRCCKWLSSLRLKPKSHFVSIQPTELYLFVGEMVYTSSKISQFAEEFCSFSFSSGGLNRIGNRNWVIAFKAVGQKTRVSMSPSRCCETSRKSSTMKLDKIQGNGERSLSGFVSGGCVRLCCLGKRTETKWFTFSRASWSHAVRVLTSSLCAVWRSCSALDFNRSRNKFVVWTGNHWLQ